MDTIQPPKNLIRFYVELQNKLESNWGENSITLLQNGKFYECYQVDSFGKALKASEILFMQISLKNGNHKSHGWDNPYMVGFPVNSLSNHLSKFLRANMVVDIYEQITLTGCTKKGYKHLKLYTPGVYIDDGASINSYIAAIDIKSWKCAITGKKLKSLDCVLLDLSTGESGYIVESSNSDVDSTLTRIIRSYNPREILVNENLKIDNCNGNLIVREIKSEWKRPSYQNELFKKIFNIKSNLKTPLEALNLNFLPEIATLFVSIYSYAWNFNKNIVNRLKYPRDLGISNHLLLNRDTVVQMHMNKLLKTLDSTKTAMGARLLKNRLFNPLINTDILEEIYETTNYFIENSIRVNLRTIGDIERQSRKMMTGDLKENDLIKLYDSIYVANEIVTEDMLSLFNSELKKRKLTKFLKDVSETVDIKELRKKESANFFINDEELNNIENQIISSKKFFYQFSEKLEEIIGSVSIDFTDRDGYYIKTTKTKLKKLDDFNFNIENINITKDDIYTEILSSSVKIKSKQFSKINSKIIKLKEELNNLLKIKYQQFLEYLTEKYYETLIKISELIAEIDFVNSSAENSRNRGYCKPSISGVGKLKAIKLRHPIIESIIDEEYIPNDVELNNNGMLIYGINAVGKSSLLRSIGTAVIMAQAGLFVAAKSFNYGIYSSIISKISTMDDIESGKSTYMMELEQISDMISRADENTLVISDELCCSTESESAHALVAAVLETLIESRSSFVFSTHLKGLQYYNLDLRLLHMDSLIENGKLVSSRILKEGGITENYGLELAAAWGLEPSFMKRAFDHRDGDEVISTKSSRYNKDVYMEACSFCKSKENLHTHHIREQHTADSQGLIENRFHKNKKFNLLVLCENCHRKIHEN